MKRQKKQFVIILIALAVVLVATFGMKTYNKNQYSRKCHSDAGKKKLRKYIG